jgi:hypothetical protein
MRKRLSILIALAAAAMIAAATVIPAFATEYDYNVLASTVCGGPSSEWVQVQTIIDYSGAGAGTVNTWDPDTGTFGNHCYWLYSQGYVEFATGGGDRMSGGGWAGGYPSSVAVDHYTSDNVVLVDNSYEFCNQSMSACNGATRPMP